MKRLIEIVGLMLGMMLGIFLIKYTYEKKVLNDVVELTQQIIEMTETRCLND